MPKKLVEYILLVLADPRGVSRDLPPSPNSFILMQFVAKNLQNNPNLGVGALPLGKFWIRHCLVMPANGNVSAENSQIH